ncbi:PqiC family protein [Burkholderia sp. IMCC1007]|uniref:PqiC family protein n=1 Tax=Burkholderia sp. IMCC1007 TaxID=3004104 RepID=UPI0022B3DD9D|nr:PqiC family protein [Burkholderia sp. IMCC1007]
MFNVIQRRGAVIRAFAAASALALSACASSPPSRFYTLAPDARAGAASTVSGPAALIDIQSVSVPDQVARNQLVVRISDTQVAVLENERWASTLSDEIRMALSIAATQQLSDFNAPRPKQQGDAHVYRVAVAIQRFESWPGARVIVDATWSIRSPRAAGEKLTCRSTVFEPVGAGYDALADGHRRALTAIAGQLAATVRALDTGAGGPLMTTTGRSANSAPTVLCPSAATHIANDAISIPGS